MKIKINETKKNLIFALLALVFSVSLFSLLIAETYKSKSRVENYRTEISEKINDNEQLRKAKKLLKQTKEEREKLFSYFVKDSEEVFFIEYIESLGGIAGVLVSTNSVDVLKNEEDDLFENIKMNVSAEGSWDEVFNFFSLLENIPYDIKINNMRIENIKGKESFTLKWQGFFDFEVSKLKI